MVQLRFQFVVFVTNIILYFKFRSELKAFLQNVNQEEQFKKYQAKLMALFLYIIFCIILILLNFLSFSIKSYQQRSFYQAIHKISYICECLCYPISVLLFCLSQAIFTDFKRTFCCCLVKDNSREEEENDNLLRRLSDVQE